MKRSFLALALLFVPAMEAQDPGEPGKIRFRAYDVLIDPLGKPLAAWQVEILSAEAGSMIAGVEGGEGEHFSKAPYYDPAALQGGRIIIAAFTTEGDPPARKVRVARIHMAEDAGSAPRTSARLMAAAQEGGERIEAKVELIGAGGK